MSLERFKQKIKYNSILRICQDALAKVGIRISFFYLVEEGLHLSLISFDSEEFRDYSAEVLNQENIDMICSINERPYKKEILLNRFKDGCGCLAVKKGCTLIGYTWFSFSSHPIKEFNFILKEHEAYLFDAYTVINYRGKNAAPFIRYQCYKELSKLGKNKFYSISQLLNRQSINFKKKLNARFILLGFYIGFFKSRPLMITLKKLIP